MRLLLDTHAFLWYILHIEPKHAAPVTTMAFHHRTPD